MAVAVMKGVLKSERMANVRLRIKMLDEPRYGGVYRLAGVTRGLARSDRSLKKPAQQSANLTNPAGNPA
jgi:hypothetical protein